MQHLVYEASGFAEVYPEHKYAIVETLQAAEHTVGMTGDGVNDAPALKKAQIGIAVEGSTDAARAAADIVLFCGTQSTRHPPIHRLSLADVPPWKVVIGERRAAATRGGAGDARAVAVSIGITIHHDHRNVKCTHRMNPPGHWHTCVLEMTNLVPESLGSFLHVRTLVRK